jgi:hypothetical protein
MKRLLTICALCAMVLCIPLAAQSPPPNATVGYGLTAGDCTSPCVTSTFDAWFMPNFQFMIGGHIDLSSSRGSGNIWTTYTDGCCLYVPQVYQAVLGTAATQGWADPEGPLLHMTADYTTGGGLPGIDQFDAYEQTFSSSSGSPLLAIKGAFTLVGSTYADRSVQLYCPATACSSYTASPTTISDRLLLGDQIPFDTINVNVTVARVGGSVTYQYWNGSTFSTLTPATDTTIGLTHLGSGTITFLPPSDWVPGVQNGSQSKYWVQITIAGASTNPILGRVYGDNLLTAGSLRGWLPSTCTGAGVINSGTPVAYCAVPKTVGCAGGVCSTARFRQQARTLGYAGVYANDFFGNPGNTQGGHLTWAYVEQARTTATLATLYTGMNGVMFDNGGSTPSQTPAFNASNTDLGSSNLVAAVSTMFAALHTLLTAQYGTSPKFWDGVNSSSNTPYVSIYTSMNWTIAEANNSANNSYNLAYDGSQGILNTDPAWGSVGSNPNGTLQIMQMIDNQQFGVWDHNGTALANYHLWDMAQRDPMDALAMYNLVRNPNIVFMYNVNGVSGYVGYDEYYYWVMSARTVAAPGVAQSTCVTACSIPLSGALEISACPGVLALACPIRLGGVDIIGTAGYTGTTLTTAAHLGASAILNNYSAGATVEYMKKGHLSMDTPPLGPGLHTPVGMWGFFIPASTVNLGIPDTTYGFSTPCTNSADTVNGGCIALSGVAASGGNPTGCASNKLSPLLRRDFTGGTYGKATVLMRPVTYLNIHTCSTEYDIPSIPYALPSTYQRLNADGTLDGAMLTSITLRGGESAILVPNSSGLTGNFKGTGNLQFSGGIQIK